MKLLTIETPVTINFIPQILLNAQDFYLHKVGYTSYDEGIFGPETEHTKTHCMGDFILLYFTYHSTNDNLNNLMRIIF
jgi:hypothetical protein